MADDMADKIKEVLNNPQMLEMLSSFMGTKANTGETNSESGEDFAEIKNVMDKIHVSSDKRITLLNALKPYMRNARASNIDKAIKMLKITQLSSILKDL